MEGVRKEKKRKEKVDRIFDARPRFELKASQIQVYSLDYRSMLIAGCLLITVYSYR
jgi:hypothetical protein